LRVDIRLFAVARQRAGRDSLGVDLAEGATVADLKRALADASPALAPIVPALLIAIDNEYAPDGSPIPPGARVAAIPPVSGGSDSDDPADAPPVTITESPIDHVALTERVRSNRAGAVCLFLGTVREITGDARTASLDYEAYPEMARRKLAELVEDARARWPIVEAAIAHRVGHLELGEVAVAVAVSCPHRREAFEACQWLMDTLKQVVPIWKKETWADGREEWVHPGLGPTPPA
jgi:molybdopterin synthase catalytic subunit